MRVPRRLSLAVRSLLALAVLATGLWLGLATARAHQEDPKTAYRAQPYTGPGYQSGLAQSSTFVGGGMQLLGPSFDAVGVTLLSWVTLPELGAGITSGNDCWGYTSPSGREYALIGTSAGTSVVEITNPGLPVVLPMIPGPTSLWRDVKVYSTFAYSVSEGGGGIQVIDLSNVDNGQVTLANTIVGPAGSTEATHNVFIDEVSGFLYRLGGASNGLRIYSLANPAAPTFVGSWSDRYIHDVQVVTYTTGPYAGLQVAFACSGLNGGSVDTGLDILDVTNKSNITTFSQTIYPGGAYSHQAWLSPDRQYLYLDDELDEGNLGVPTKTFVFDVSDLAVPVLTGDFTNGNPSIGHNLYTLGDLIFQANYRSGMRIFDASNPLSVSKIGYFDTYPNDDNTQFNGLWSVYPYFPSGTVIGSDLERGLFVWQIGDPPLSFSYPSGKPTQLDPLGGTMIDVDIVAASGQALDSQSPTLWVDTGTGFTAIPMTAITATLYEGVFPAADCGSDVDWYVSASSLAGTVLADPLSAPGTFTSTPARLGETLVSSDTVEIDLGWTAGDPSDTATTGLWVRGNPLGTAAQPEDDHTPGVGTDCWYTGAGTPGGALGEDDLDGGVATLFTPTFDLSAGTLPVISYWRWFSNSAGAAAFEDVLEVSISNNGGQAWVLVETVGPAGLEVNGGWFQHSFAPLDFVPLTANMQLRFVAGDLGAGSIVEAAIDDLEVIEIVCNDCNGNGIDDAADIASGLSVDANFDDVPDECQSLGCPTPFIRGDTNADGVIDLSDVISTLVYLFGGGAPPVPLESADINAGGTINIADAIGLLSWLFTSGPPPAAPFPDLGCP